MNFKVFSTGTTNIFPIANSANGGQYLSEFNLRSRETVWTDPTVTYSIGLSFTHGFDDYKVQVQQNSSGVQTGNLTLQILPGRALVNGHYVENLAPIAIDLDAANQDLSDHSMEMLDGDLAVGLRAFYSTESTIAGSLEIEDEADEYYQGIQVVIVPKKELVLPTDSPDDPDQVNCHLLLATMTLIRGNGVITNIKQNPQKVCGIPAERIGSMSKALSSDFVSKRDLNPKRNYVFSGKGTNPNTGRDTWCDATNALVNWAADSQRVSTPPISQAEFGYNEKGETTLTLPILTPDGMVDSYGNAEYYESRVMKLPVANYSKNTPGTVDQTYTNNIKLLAKKLAEAYHIADGDQIYYLEEKDDDGDPLHTLPSIKSGWNIGDYVLVGQDYTVENVASDMRAPSTFYAIVPGPVKSYEYAGTSVPNNKGVELEQVEINNFTAPSSGTSYNSGDNDGPFSDCDQFRGQAGKDYFTVINNGNKYYYKVSASGPRDWSDAIFLTGTFGLAQEELVGGFYNIANTNLDQGYVALDGDGHLVLLDYGLLRTGVLAYQLGEDYTIPAESTVAETQTQLNEYVNERVAFPNATQVANSKTPNIINIYINLAAEDSEAVLDFGNIDSRFGAIIYLHIAGSATASTTINIHDCQKLRIDSNIEGTPVINLYRSNLYYDPAVLNYIIGCPRDSNSYSSDFTGIEGLQLWYEKFNSTDPNLVVNGLTVDELDAAIIAQRIDFWNELSPNDNHFKVALNSITFAHTGIITGCELLVANLSTENIETGKKIVVGDFTLPQGEGLIYPYKCVTKPLKVVGNFTNGYYTGANDAWLISNTNFTALTQTYIGDTTISGSIAFNTDTEYITADLPENIEDAGIECWAKDKYARFSGGAIV